MIRIIPPLGSCGYEIRILPITVWVYSHLFEPCFNVRRHAYSAPAFGGIY